MNFFEHQDQARRQTGRLVVLFLLAVICIVIAVNLAFVLVSSFISAYSTDSVTITTGLDVFGSVNPRIYLIATLCTLAVIVTGTSVRMLQLAKGGEAVARMVGARQINHGTTDPEEKRLLNVVDEMAIASGTSVPGVYVMDNEQGINAFAAGYTPNSAIIAVTDGTLRILDRDELQGVIAHEFSHVLNGDMRLNIRLMGVLNGILVIGTIGLYILRGFGRARYRSSRDGKGVAVVMLMGLALAVIGYTGVFFGRLIKSAVSRQREFLADASAVQFTRNPEGIGHALNKIRASTQGSIVTDKHAEELSHMFFGEGFKISFMAKQLASHPPIEERIKRILPGLDLTAPLPAVEYPTASSDEQSDKAKAASDIMSGFHGSKVVRANVGDVIDSVGNPGAEHTAYASSLYKSIPVQVMEALDTADNARALLYCFLLDQDHSIRERQIKRLHENEDNSVVKMAWSLFEYVDRMLVHYRLPVIDLAIPALRSMQQSERDHFLARVKELITADNKYSPHEFVILTILQRQLSSDAQRADRIKYRQLSPLLPDCVLVLSMLAYAGQPKMSQAKNAFNKGIRKLECAEQLLIEPANCKPANVQHALDRLRSLAPKYRRNIIDACASTVLADGEVRIEEAELLRAISESIDCPMPPLT